MQNKNLFLTTLLVMAFALLFGGNAQAQTNGIVKVDNIDYQIADESAAECTVVNIPISLTNVIIPQTISYNGREYTVTKIGKRAVNGSNGFGWFQDVKLPNTIRVIEESAFESCEIKRINIPESVTKIESLAFNDNPDPELVYLDINSDCKFNIMAMKPKAVFCSPSKKALCEKMNDASDFIHVAPSKICALNSIDDFWNMTEKKELTKANMVGTWKHVSNEKDFQSKTSYNITMKLSSNGDVNNNTKCHRVLNNNNLFKEVDCKRTWSGSWILGENNSFKFVMNKPTLKNNISYVPTEETRLGEKYDTQLKAQNKKKATEWFALSGDVMLFWGDNRIEYFGKDVIIDKYYVWLRTNETAAAKTTAKKTTAKKTTAKKTTTKKK